MRSIFVYGLSRIILDLLEVLQLILILLIDVLEVLAGDQALDTLIFLQLAGEEGRRGVVGLAVDAQGGLWELLRSVHQERVIDDLLL